MQSLMVLLLILGLLLVFVFWLVLNRLKHRKLLQTGFWSFQTLLILFAFFSVLLVLANLNTYQRLSYEKAVANIYIRQLALQKYQIALEFVESKQTDQQTYFVLNGDEWQLDSRILKWKGWVNLVGLDSFFQLVRLSGRYADINQAKQSTVSAFELSTQNKGLNLWQLKRKLQDKLWFIDTYFGQSVFMPMSNGAHYELSVGQAGLLVRPRNEVAKLAVKQWK